MVKVNSLFKLHTIHFTPFFSVLSMVALMSCLSSLFLSQITRSATCLLFIFFFVSHSNFKSFFSSFLPLIGKIVFWLIDSNRKEEDKRLIEAEAEVIGRGSILVGNGDINESTCSVAGYIKFIADISCETYYFGLKKVA
jgi:hypothetical protein